jgi:hypothetical protein
MGTLTAGPPIEASPLKRRVEIIDTEEQQEALPIVP